jgi:hypothetical protein
MSWQCCKVVDYCKEKGDVDSSNHKCLVEWNDINKTKSRVNYFASSLSNPNSIISFAGNNNLLDKMPFCHLIQFRTISISKIFTAFHKQSKIGYANRVKSAIVKIFRSFVLFLDGK